MAQQIFASFLPGGVRNTKISRFNKQVRGPLCILLLNLCKYFRASVVPHFNVLPSSLDLAVKIVMGKTI